MRVIAMVLAGGLAGMGAAAAADDPGIALTVYNNDLGLVKDVRRIDLVKGIQELRFDDVAARIDPTSVHIKAVEHPNDVAVLEQNFQYDLASADRLLSRFLNNPVIAVMKEGGDRTGTLLSFDGGNLVLQGEGTSVSVINRSEVRTINLDELPGGLVVKPTLVWSLDSDRAGSEPIEVSYLTGGIQWHAEYVAVVNAKDTGLELTGWVSIDNQSGATYENARLKLVAGDVHRAPPEHLQPPVVYSMAQAGRAPQFEEESFFEYHLYTLERPATVRDRETKQLSLFPAAAAKVTKKMTYDGARRPKDVVVSLEMDNSKANGLGMALPKGMVRVYKKGGDGAQEFVGEDRIDHTARDERVRLTLGNAFDVVGERTQTDFQRIGTRGSKVSVKIDIRNHKDEAVDVAVIEHLHGDWDVTQNSTDFKKVDSRTIEFPVRVEAGGEVSVTYTARIQN